MEKDIKKNKLEKVVSLKPKIYLQEGIHEKAAEILREVFELSSVKDGCIGVWTRLKPYKGDEFEFVATPCTGPDHIETTKHVLCLDKRFKRTVGRSITSTAEHTISLILQLAKLKRMQIYEKELGVIGIGRIGKMVTNMISIGFNLGIRLCDIKDDITNLIKVSDIITLHVPLDDSTRKMISEKQFNMMKEGALLVNTSRAEIVDEEALYNALSSKKIYYADDFLGSHSAKFLKRCEDLEDRCIFTPHIGGNCLEARETTDLWLANSILEYWTNKKGGNI